MKLIDLLNYIPDECKIVLAMFGEQRHGVIDYKYDAIVRFAYRHKLTEDQVKNMDVSSIYPCACVQCSEEYVFNNDIPSLYVKPQIVIEIE